MSILYVGSYLWSRSDGTSSSSSSTSGTISVSDVAVLLNDAHFSDCQALTATTGAGIGGSFSAHSFGGSVSVLHVGSHSWSRNAAANSSSSSTCGATSVGVVAVRIANVHSFDSQALTSTEGFSTSASSYGGSISIMYIGAYAWSLNDFEGPFSNSSSICGSTSVSEVNVNVTDTACSNCSAVSSTSRGSSTAANSYGGSMSIMYIGAYSFSWSGGADSNSSSLCAATSASKLSIHSSKSGCFNCSANTSTIGGDIGESYSSSSYGGSTSVLYFGAYSWSSSGGSSNSRSTSTCGATFANEIFIHISDSACYDCSAVSIAGGRGHQSYFAISSGGSMSVLQIGAISWSFSFFESSSKCAGTVSNMAFVQVTNLILSKCRAMSTALGSDSSMSYGGSISASHIGAYAYSIVLIAGGQFGQKSESSVADSNVHQLSIIVENAVITDSVALSGKYFRVFFSILY
jgi:hypothetical protein